MVTVTDACPCQHENEYSNRRWCCGDAEHLDLSVFAFEKLAPKNDGVIGIQYRTVPCDHRPRLVATTHYPTQQRIDPYAKKPTNCGGPTGYQCDGGTGDEVPQAYHIQKGEDGEEKDEG